MALHCIKKNGQSLEIRFASQLSNVDEAINQLEKFIRREQIAVDHFSFIYIMREALNNAVIHGNGQDDSLLVFFSLAVVGDKLLITVRDEGKGFAWRQRLAQADVPASEATSGRGLFSMLNFHYQVTYNEQGNELFLQKKLTVQPQQGNNKR